MTLLFEVAPFTTVHAFIILFFLLIGLYVFSIDTIHIEDTPYYTEHFVGIQFSVQQFYSVLTELLEEKEIPGLLTAIITRQERGWFSPNRMYLRIRRKDLVIDVCSFHFGNGQFISCRSGSKEDLRKSLFGKDSTINKFLDTVFYPETYYKTDQQTMFKKLVNGTIAETIASIKTNYGAESFKH